MNKSTEIKGGVTAPKGFLAAGTCAGIKEDGKKDMAMIKSTVPAVAAGIFTTNVVAAAPVRFDRHLIEQSPYIEAVVVNSGIANAATGSDGLSDCKEMAKEAALCLQVPEDAVLVASTGVIGPRLPMEKIKAGIKDLSGHLSDSEMAGNEAAFGIITTDTRTKETAVRTKIGQKTVRIGAMCKGSGMIAPNMATMLCFVMTDAAISKELLQKALTDAAADTFNMISIDGDTSTNDSVLLLANGEAENLEITEENDDYETFYAALRDVMLTLSKMIAGDGEGADCLFLTHVKGVRTKEEARKLAKSVIRSNLTKAAIYGHDANWGRILCALGYAGVPFDPDKVDIWFESAAGELKVAENGREVHFDEETAAKILSEKEVTILCDMKMGNEEATAYGCDLTLDYVRINSDYRS